MQIKGPANDYLGMFDYEFSEEYYRGLYETLSNIASVGSFVHIVVEALWKRTESDLEAASPQSTGN